MYTVYCHTNKINNKRYVGVTRQKPEKRWNNGLGYQHSTYFYNAIKKYGWHNFSHEILYSGLNKEDAENIEKFLIKEWSLQNPKYGYNIETGGNLNKQLNEITKLKISKAKKGRKMTAEQVEKMAKHKRGVPLSEKHKLNISKGATKYIIVQMNQMGEILNKFESVAEAVKTSGVGRATLYSHLNNKVKDTSRSKFLWKKEMSNVS